MDFSEFFFYLLYLILNFIVYILVLFSQKESITSFSTSFHIIQLFSSCLTIYFIILTRNKPGYVEKDKYLEEELKKKEPESKSEINVESSPIVNLNLIPNNGCETCQITKLPLRTQHCQKCQKCVKGFDHHCWILAGCIGENNRFKFILFLFFQNISIIFSTYGILKIINNQESEILEYILTFLFSIMCLFEIIFFWILLYHIYLLITNQSTYELFNEKQCPYLSIFIEERTKILAQRGISIINNSKPRPFDIGISNNINLYLKKMFNSQKTINWEDLYFEKLKTNQIRLYCGDKEIHN